MAGEITLRELSPQLREFIENSGGGGSINADIKTCGFTAEKGQTTFTIPFENYIAEECYLDVKVNSIWVSPNEYTVNIREVVFNTPLEEGTEVFFTIYLLGATAVNSVNADVVVENENKKFVTSQEKSKIAEIDSLKNNQNRVEEQVNILNSGRGYLNTVTLTQDTDLNTITENGKYVVNTNVNSPSTTKYSYVIDVTSHYNGKPHRVKQVASIINNTLYKTYIRFRNENNVWSAWQEIATSNNINDITFKTETLNGSGDLNNYTTNCKVKIGNCVGVLNTPIATNTGNNTVLEVFEGYGGVTQMYHSGNAKKSWIRYYASWFVPQWTDWKEVTTNDVKTTDLTLLNGWTPVYAKCTKVGRVVFVNISCYGGTYSGGTVICNLQYKPVDEISLIAFYRNNTTYTQTPCNIGARTNNNIRFSSTTQPAYNGTDRLEIIGFYMTNE